MSDRSKAEKTTGAKGAGQSGGGPYPNPHTGKEEKGEGGGMDGFTGHGGQSEMDYHGKGRLGSRKTGGNANAPASGSDRGK